MPVKTAAKQEDGYFTPDIEDLKVGYEHEYLIDGSWKKSIILNLDEFEQLDLDRIRVPYLTKEQIEAEGWTFKRKSVDLWWEKEGNFQIGNWTSYKIVMHYGMYGHVGNQDLRLFIYAEDQGSEHNLFEGECPDINTFRYICKLLNIK